MAAWCSWRSRKKIKAVHPELQLETVTKGPFEHSEPTLRNGVDLDVPTFVRRGMVMNQGGAGGASPPAIFWLSLQTGCRREAGLLPKGVEEV